MKIKISVLSILAFLLVLSFYVFYIFFTSGFWREVKAFPSSGVYGEIHLPGIEDIAVQYSGSFMILSSDDRKAHRDNICEQGHLYSVNLDDPTFFPYRLTGHLDFPFHPHGISIYQTDSLRWVIWAINHAEGRHSVEKFEFNKSELNHLETILDERFVSPNDLVALDSIRFFVTNDHKYTSGFRRLVEDYLGMKWSNVLFYDGNTCHEVLSGISYANGITLDRNTQQLYIASPRRFSLIRTSYNVESGRLSDTESFFVGTGIDNLEWDLQGRLLAGAHPNLLAFTAYARGKRELAPSEVIQIDIQGKPNSAESQTVFEDNGYLLSASSIAIDLDSLVAIGSVMDSKVLLIKK